jgi:hypothetical protein
MYKICHSFAHSLKTSRLQNRALRGQDYHHQFFHHQCLELASIKMDFPAECKLWSWDLLKQRTIAVTVVQLTNRVIDLSQDGHQIMTPENQMIIT